LDVVFVHGLKGDPKATWQGVDQEGKTTFWPEWLAQDVPGVRVWSVGYPSTLTTWFGKTLPIAGLAGNLAMRLQTQGVGERPLIMVGHSMGGLIIKSLLCQSAHEDSNTKLQQLWLNTCGVAFLGTPHAGSGLASIKSFFSHWVSLFKSEAKANADELEHHGQSLFDLNNRFRKLADQRFGQNQLPSIAAFQETQSVGGLMVVDLQSADPQISHAQVSALPADDHISMCKPSSREALPYQWLHWQAKYWAPAQTSGFDEGGYVWLSYLRGGESSNPLDEAIHNLIKWLRQQGINLKCDLDFLGKRAPAGGWSAWRQRCVDQAHTVLVVGGADFPAVFEGAAVMNDAQWFGRLALTRDLYDKHAATPDRFLPVLFDHAPVSHLPAVLHDWWSQLRFPSRHQAILEAILSPVHAPRIADTKGTQP
jgi:hypothetical protein